MIKYRFFAALVLLLILSGCETRTWTATGKCIYWYHLNIELANFDSTDIDTFIINTYHNDSTTQKVSSSTYARTGNKYRLITNTNATSSWQLKSYDTTFTNRYKLRIELYQRSIIPGENLELEWPSAGKRILISSFEPDGKEEIQYKADPYTEPEHCYRFLKSYNVASQVKSDTLVIDK